LQDKPGVGQILIRRAEVIANKFAAKVFFEVHYRLEPVSKHSGIRAFRRGGSVAKAFDPRKKVGTFARSRMVGEQFGEQLFPKITDSVRTPAFSPSVNC